MRKCSLFALIFFLIVSFGGFTPRATAHAEQYGGNIVLAGTDSDLHNNSMFKNVVNGMLAKVSNGGAGILVIGANRYKNYWTTTIGLTDVTYVNGADNISKQSLVGYKMIILPSSYIFGGITDAENDALTKRSGDIASFINHGGALLSLTSYSLKNPLGLLSDVGTFVTPASNYNAIVPTADGEAVGITTALNGDASHTVFTQYPDFMKVLAAVDPASPYTKDGGKAAIIGGNVIVPGIIADTTTLTMAGGDTHPLTVTRLAADGSTTDVTGESTYSSDNEDVAVVNSQGVITAKRPGVANIKISNILVTNSGNVTQTLNVPVCVPGLIFDKSSYLITVGNNQPFSVTEYDDAGNATDRTAESTLNSNDSSIVTVDNTGMMTGESLGTTTVTANYNGQTAEATVVVPNNNADLNAIQLNGTSIDGFDKDTTAYTVNVGSDISTATVTGDVYDDHASVRVTGDSSLSYGANSFLLAVTAEDRVTTKSYSLNVNRLNTSLSSISINDTPIGDFDPTVMQYTYGTVPNSTTAISVSGIPADPGAAVTVTGADHLTVGSNTITISVNNDGVIQTYKIVVDRQASSDASLGNLRISEGSLSPDFSGNIYTYDVDVPHSTSSVTVTADVFEPNATIKINNADTVSGAPSEPIDLMVGDNEMNILVTAQDGVSTALYKVNVHRQPSHDANLGVLSLSDGTLTPDFDPGITSFSVNVPYSTSKLDITTTTHDSAASLVVNGTLANSGSVSVPLNTGNNEITVIVTAQDGSTKTYTITAYRAAHHHSSSSSSPSSTETSRGTVEGTFTDNNNETGNTGTTQEPGKSQSGPTSLSSLLTGASTTLKAAIVDKDGKTLPIPDVDIDKNGNFKIDNIAPGHYQMVIYVTAPNGERLAGTTASLTVDSNGQASVKENLIDPYGIILDAMTKKPVDGVKMTLYWADTALNKSKNRVPNTVVHLPELSNFNPNHNQNPQFTQQGQYGWMVYPDGDYYFTAEKDGYKIYDSRQDMRDEKHGDTSYMKEGIIHVGDTIVQVNFNLEPKIVTEGTHQPYMGGYPDGTFKPDQSITRAEMAAVLSRTMTKANAVSSTIFPDVSSKFWAAKVIAEVNGQGWMKGDPNGSFRPADLLTRGEMATILMKIKHLPEGNESKFKDISSHWAYQAISSVESAGLMSGYPDGTFQPNKPVSRAEVVTVINRLLDRRPYQVADQSKLSDVSPSNWAYSQIMEVSESHDYLEYGNGMEIWK